MNRTALEAAAAVIAINAKALPIPGPNPKEIPRWHFASLARPRRGTVPSIPRPGKWKAPRLVPLRIPVATDAKAKAKARRAIAVVVPIGRKLKTGSLVPT